MTSVFGQIAPQSSSTATTLIDSDAVRSDAIPVPSSLLDPSLPPRTSLASVWAPTVTSAGVVNVAPTGNDDIDGLLFGTKWTGSVTFSFPDAVGDYPAIYGSGEPTAPGFAQVSPAQMQAFFAAAAMVSSYTNIVLSYAGTGTADIQIAQSSAADPTAYAYYPWASAEGGDIWIGTEWDYTQPTTGDYNFMTMLHEFGHSLGLKNSHEAGGVANVPVPLEHDALEYTIESYRSYIGGPTTGGYTNEWFGFPSTYMMNDILALQTLYGADYTTQSSNTVYAWDPATGQQFINGVGQAIPGGGSAGPTSNRVFMTIWDGGGRDTYDLSNYTTPATINLAPGEFSITSEYQRAYLGDGHYAQGTVYNAYLFNTDARSLIEDAIGGSGSDQITGNAVANELRGGGGDDVLFGMAGRDTLIGGAGMDILNGGAGVDTLSYSISSAAVIVNLAAGTALGSDAQGDVIAAFENLTGGAGNDVLTGNAGTNVLSGGVGNDLLQGGSGGDRLLGDIGRDTASYLSAATGVVVSFANLALNTGDAAGDSYQMVENILGTAWNDTLTGNAKANTIGGETGNDVLAGLGGNDILAGGGNNDRLNGGEGRDTLSGGSAADVFEYTAVDDSGTTALTRDIVTDFIHLKDKIDLSAIDAIVGGGDDPFIFIGTADFSAAGQVRAVQEGGNSILEINTDGIDVAEMTIQLTNVVAASLTDVDFIV